MNEEKNLGRRANGLGTPHQLDAPNFRLLSQANSQASQPARSHLFALLSPLSFLAQRSSAFYSLRLSSSALLLSPLSCSRAAPLPGSSQSLASDPPGEVVRFLSREVGRVCAKKNDLRGHGSFAQNVRSCFSANHTEVAMSVQQAAKTKSLGFGHSPYPRTRRVGGKSTRN